MSRSDQRNLPSRTVPARRDLDTPSGAQSAWHSSLAAVCEAVGLGGTSSEDAKILLLLLSCLSPSDKIPLDIFRGAMPRKRWTAEGEIEEVDAIYVGLAPELRNLISDNPRLRNAFHQLDLISAISKDPDQTYALDKAVASYVRESLRAGDLSF